MFRVSYFSYFYFVISAKNNYSVTLGIASKNRPFASRRRP